MGGLICAALGLALDNIWFVAVAGFLALVAGVCTFRINERLQRASNRVEEGAAEAARLSMESQVMAARAARFEAEAINARLMAAQTERAAAMSELTIDELAGMVDNDTGLFNEKFFVVTTEKRLSAARRGLRPLTIVLLEVAEKVSDGVGHPAEPRTIAACLMETLRDADTACRLGTAASPWSSRTRPRTGRSGPSNGCGAGWPTSTVTSRCGPAWPATRPTPSTPVRSSSRPSGPSRGAGLAPGPHRGRHRFSDSPSVR